MKLETISSEEIMTTPLKPIEFCVANLIASGLYILAGVPKSGKSWLALVTATTDMVSNIAHRIVFMKVSLMS